MALLISCSCSKRDEGDIEVSNPDAIDVSAETLKRVSMLRIAFGHQSVGGEIVMGIQDISSMSGMALRVTEGEPDGEAPGLYHFKIGQNGFPEGKIQDFERIMRRGSIAGPDVAIMKLCYIDFDLNQDPEGLARTYISALEHLASDFPATTYLAVTAPLTTVQTGPKAWIKRLLGRQPAGIDGNLRRARFNSILRAHYENSNRLFDLASLESQSGAIYFENGRQKVEALDPSLTYDGGHLNGAGKHRVAVALLEHIARLKP